MNEEWRPIPDFEGFYEVSSQGQVRSVDRVLPRNGSPLKCKGVMLKPQILHGRPMVCLRRPGLPRGRRAQIAHLVLLAFVGPRPEGLVCCHYDDNPLNNSVDNLRWDTISANRRDCVRNGTDSNASKTHCSNGHEFTPENTRLLNDGRARWCRACGRTNKNRWAARKRQERAA